MTRVWRLIALSGCAVSPLSPQQVKDSAGIRVVDYHRASVPIERWTLETRPVLELGRDAAEGPQSFVNIMGIVRLSDGNIAVANGRPSEIRIIAPDGRLLRSLGRNAQAGSDDVVGATLGDDDVEHVTMYRIRR